MIAMCDRKQRALGSWAIFVAIAGIANFAAASLARAEAEDDSGAKSTSRLPFMAEEARKRGYDLPLPFGASLVVIGLGNREIDVSDVRIGINGNPPQSVSQFLDLGSHSDVFNANLKFDAWLLPFLNVYAIAGYVHNTSNTHIRVTLPKPGPNPGTIVFDKDVETELDGLVGGVGTTLAGGIGNFYGVVDVNYVQSDLGFDDKFSARSE